MSVFEVMLFIAASNKVTKRQLTTGAILMTTLTSSSVHLPFLLFLQTKGTWDMG